MCDRLAELAPERVEGDAAAVAELTVDMIPEFLPMLRELFLFLAEDVWELELTQVYSAQVLRYDVGQEKAWHHDGMLGADRPWLGVVVMLDDEDAYEGGELQMAGQAPWSLGKGDVMAFAGHAPHRVLPVTAGTRRTVTAFAY